ncbi:hypothetical protein EOM81_11500, partial [bacterium]|nr:hypothetical protein [bacterium]
MPVIHERSDGKFYIIEKPRRSGQYITWQMKAQCVEYLKKYSLLRDDLKIKSYTVILFRLLGYVFTNNQGYEEVSSITEARFPADFQSLPAAEKALIRELNFLLKRTPRIEKKEGFKPLQIELPAFALQLPAKKIEKEQEIYRAKKVAIARVNCRICKKTLGLFENCCLSLEKQIFVCSVCGSEETFGSVLRHMMGHGCE